MITTRFGRLFLQGLLSIFLFVPGSVLAQLEQQHVRHVDTINTSADIFESEDPMKITLTLDLKLYQKEKMKGALLPGTLPG